MLKALQDARPGATVLLENNGSLDISVVPSEVIAIMDIKCPASGAGDAFDWQNLKRLRRQDEVKFAISDRADFDWAIRIVVEHALASKCHAVLMSPVWGRVEPSVLAEWLMASRAPARLNLQIHKLLEMR